MRREKANLAAVRISTEEFRDSSATRIASAVLANSSDTASAGGLDEGEVFAGVQSENPRARVPSAIMR